jgi:hypothetical protein
MPGSRLNPHCGSGVRPQRDLRFAVSRLAVSEPFAAVKV